MQRRLSLEKLQESFEKRMKAQTGKRFKHRQQIVFKSILRKDESDYNMFRYEKKIR